MKINSILIKLDLLLCLVVIFFPTLSLAQRNTYPVNSRSVFLAGCLLEDPPNFKNDGQIVKRMGVCVCLLDKFQENYTNQEFQLLFAGASRNEQPYTRELQDFSNRHLGNCLS